MGRAGLSPGRCRRPSGPCRRRDPGRAVGGGIVESTCPPLNLRSLAQFSRIGSAAGADAQNVESPTEPLRSCNNCDASCAPELERVASSDVDDFPRRMATQALDKIRR
jgi:hypothetical protein